jgi:hypothetical protein
MDDTRQVLQALNENSAINAELFGQHFSATGLIPCVLVAGLVLAVIWFRLRRRRPDCGKSDAA